MRIITLILLFFASIQSFGQASLTPIGISQNFNTMGSSPITTLPTGFKVGPGSVPDWSTGVDTTNRSYGTTGLAAVTGTSAGGCVNWANGVNATSTDRGIGFLNSNTYSSPRSIIFSFTNNTGTTITTLHISFEYRKYRSGSRQFDWTFFHGPTSTPAIPDPMGNQSYPADLNNLIVFNPPSSVSKSFYISGLSIPVGSAYYLRWTLTGIGGSTNAQGLGIDNFKISHPDFQSRQTGTWSDFTTWNIGTNGVWIPSPIGSLPSSLSNVIIQNGHTVTTTTSTICKDLTINGSLSLGSNLSVNGNWSKSSTGNITTNDNIIYFTGSSNSTISGEQTFDKLHLTKTSSTLSLSDNISINKELLVTSGTLDLANKDITILSKQSHTAYVGKVTGNISYSGSGRFIVERYIATGLGSGQHLRSWQLLSIPTSGTQTIKSAWQEGSLTPNSNPNPGYGTQITNNNQNWQADGFDAFSPGNPSMRYYNSTTNSWVSVLSTNEPIYNPNGYMVFVRGDRSVTGFGTPVPTILRTRGQIFEPNNLPPVINVSGNSYASVGNPYPSAVNLSGIIRSGGVQDIFYVWDPRLGGDYNVGGYQKISGNGLGSYTVLPGGGSYVTGISSIESGQAFFVYSDLIPGSVSFNEESKNNTSNLVTRPIFNRTSQIISKLSVLHNGSFILIDGVLSEFGNRLSNSIDMWDYRNISNSEGVSILRDGIRLVTERRSNIEFTDTIFYSFNFRVRKYKLDFTSFNMNGIKKIILNDRYLNTKHDINLRDTTSHIFDVTSDPNSSRSDRFYLVLYKKIGRELFNTKIIVSPNPSTNFINISTNLVDGRYEYIISDVLGNPKKSSILMIIGGRATINTGLNEGVYQLTIRDKTQSISTNFISK